ncbi:methyltransferase domain-containing protein [Candidatus Woesearchaeota archaeon]|nr:methyltransferase domain-containing protein [Candidatus Woesearchaeota archaeon]
MQFSKEKVREHFEKSASYYSKTSIGFILEARLRYFKKHTRDNDCVLEIGCGSGNILSNIPGKKVGMDISLNMVKECKKKIKGLFCVGDAEHLPFKEGVFDRIIISEVLYYLPNKEKLVDEIHRCLKPSGEILITSLNRPYTFVRTVLDFLKIGAHDNIGMEFTDFKRFKAQLAKKFKIREVRSIPFAFVPPRYSLIFFIRAAK